MERFQIFKKQRGIQLFYMIFGLSSLTLGITLLINTFETSFRTNFPDGDWNGVIYSLQGIIFFTIGHLWRKNEKYFIEWNNEELRYLFPKNKLIENIKWSDIKGIKIDTLKINIELSGDHKIINLDNLQYKEVKRIKEKFEEMNATI
ncbi:hypothetical protein [Labilibaculum sp.]|uniref:hypothetical protein n=1 Tax=Labilibaculum sp. TaxID=2060723 RepID=UPI003561C4AD